jgi:protein-disulfide isomerase
MKKYLPIIIILGVLGVAIAAGLYLLQPAGTSEPLPPSQPSKPAAVNPTTASPGAVPAHSIGLEGAPVTIEEFGDFECPPCATFHPVLKSIKTEYGPRIRVIFREFPLVPTHQHALAAARAAEAAGLQGKFWEMHDLLYENQRIWHESKDSRPIFEDYARQLGLNLERFRKDVASDLVQQRIFLDGKRGHSLGVKGTPTVFLNGRELPFESLAPDRLRGLINAELATTGK